MRFFFFISIVFFSCSNDPDLVKEFVPSTNLPVEQIEGAEMLHTEHGKLKVKIRATKIERFQDVPQLVFSSGIEVVFYNDSGFVQSQLLADAADIDEDNNIMTARHNVILISSDDKQLETDELIWNERKNMIYSSKDVKINTGKEIIFGEGFTSNPDFTKYSISKIHGTFDFKNTN